MSNGQQNYGGLVEATRPRAWDELSTDEKIERLRDCLRSKDMAITSLRQEVSALMNHSHGSHGELLRPMYVLGDVPPGLKYDPLA